MASENAWALTDFGLAQMLERTVGANPLEGTLGYMSPSQARREDLDGRSDLYAIGIMLWELLALRAKLPSDISTTITRAAREQGPLPHAVVITGITGRQGPSSATTRRHPVVEGGPRPPS